MKTSTRGVPVPSPSVPLLRYTPGSYRGRYHTDRQPGAALQNTAICPDGPGAERNDYPDSPPGDPPPCHGHHAVAGRKYL